MPKCKRQSCSSNVIKDSPSHFVCAGPGGCGKNYHISCARIIVQTIASATCCRAAVKAFDNNINKSNTAASFDKNRPLLNSSDYLSEDSVNNITNTVIQSSSPNSILDMNFSQLVTSASQPTIISNTSSQSLPLTTINSLPVTSLSSNVVMTSTYTTTIASTVPTFTNTTISTPLLVQSSSNNQNLIHMDTGNNEHQIRENVNTEQQDVHFDTRVIKPLGPPIIYPITDELHLTNDIAQNQMNPSTWATTSMDDKLFQIMSGITNLQTSVNTFQQGYNTLVQKCSQIESEVRQNRDYIVGINGDLRAVDKVAVTAFNAIKVAELDIQKVHSTLSTSDTQFMGRETVISGIPAHCQMSDREVADRFLIAIGAEHLIFHITDVQELKTKNINQDNQDYYKLIVKFSSFQLRKDVMSFKRRRGKVTFGDLFPPTQIPHDANKILYFNDLLPLDMHKRYTKISKFFKLNREISIFCNEGQVFFKRNRDPPVLIPDDFDLDKLHTL